MLFSTQPVSLIKTDGRNKVCGIVLQDGSEVKAKVVLSNATPEVTYFDLLPQVSIIYSESHSHNNIFFSGNAFS